MKMLRMGGGEGGIAHSGEVLKDKDSKGKFGRIERSGRPS